MSFIFLLTHILLLKHILTVIFMMKAHIHNAHGKKLQIVFEDETILKTVPGILTEG